MGEGAAVTERWWAPGSTMPLDVLLEAGSDRQMDLANALVAYHRVGAMACETARSEADLVDNLVAARASFAPALVGSISKSVEGGGPYAGLLVRDVADAAESAALDLYRQAVARGVAPTLAAQRVGMAYGVPADGMGAFRPLALAPATQVAALHDAADKALFEFVHKVATEETDSKELVSKEGEQERARPRVRESWMDQLAQEDESEYLEEHGVDNGPKGRFVSARSRLGTGQSAPPSVGRTEREARVARTARVARKARVARQPAARAALERAPLQRAKLDRQPGARRVAQRDPLQKKAIVNAAAATEEDKAGAAADAGEGSARWLSRLSEHDFSDRDLDTDTVYGKLNQSVALHLDQAEWAALVQNSGGQGTADSPRLFRMGHLSEHMGAHQGPVSYGQGEDDEVKGLEDKIKAMEHADDYATGVNTMPMSKAEYDDPDTRRGYARKLAREWAEIQNPHLDPENPAEQATLEQRASDYTKHVYFPNDYQAQKGPGSRLAVIVDREEGDVLKVRQIVTLDTTGKRDIDGKIKMAPNQVYRLSRTAKTFFDDVAGVEVEVWTANPITDMDMQQQVSRNRFGKASAYEDRHNVDHGVGGRFVRERDTAPQRESWMDQLEAHQEETLPVERIERVERVARQPRTARVARTARQPRGRTERAPLERAPLARQATDRVSGERTPLSRGAQQVIESIKAKRYPPDFGLLANHDYIAVSDDGMASLLESVKWEPGDESISLPRRVREGLVEGASKSKATRERIGQYIFDDLDYLGDYKDGLSPHKVVGADELEAAVEAMFEENPHLQQVYIEELEGAAVLGAPDQAQMSIMGHGDDHMPTHVVEVDREYDHDWNGELLDEGVRMAQDFDWQPATRTRSTSDGRLETTTYGYFVTRPLLHRWRLVNSDDTPPSGLPRHNPDERG